jgi:hypothetical protein
MSIHRVNSSLQVKSEFVVVYCDSIEEIHQITDVTGSWYKYSIVPTGDGCILWYGIIEPKAVELYNLIKAVHPRVTLQNWQPAKP